MQDTINLRVLGFVVNNGIFQLICLETDIAVTAESFADAKIKMIDALTSYFKTFKVEELENGDYERPAPLRYRAFWHVGMFTNHFIRGLPVIMSSNADYNTHSRNLSLA